MKNKQRIYLISTRYTRTSKGPRYFCQVFLQELDGKGGGFRPQDITDEIAGMFHFNIKDNSIQIYYGSGTGYMVLEQRLRDRFGPDTKVFNVSVFNQ